MTRVLLHALAMALAPIADIAAQQSGYVDSRQCAPCHPKISETYQHTGMARLFSLTRRLDSVPDFHHSPTDTHYSLNPRDGKVYQRRWQIGFDGNETNVEEMSVDAVLGSGNHALTFLHRTPRGTLTELPLAWYSENGGSWNMNPGYDSPRPPVRRPVDGECMFCRNAYPRNGAKDLPEGIDCQRCLGPGAKHIAAPATANIVNPARLSNERQMEVCMQCHLETTSTRLPSLVRRFERGPFSYRPGEPIGGFVISFDHAPGTGHVDKFEIAGAAYRLRQSKCFLASKGALTCTACQDPHDIPRGQEAVAYYAAACRKCDTDQPAGHPESEDCAACHMPKRLTDDAVHVLMTDHKIQRTLTPLTPTAGDYGGEVVPYYPAPLPPSGENALYTALAQVLQKTKLTDGVAKLSALLKQKPQQNPGFSIALGDARAASGNTPQAIETYRQALRFRPSDAVARRSLGVALRQSGAAAEADAAFRQAVRLAPTDAQSWFELGEFEKAVTLNPDRPDYHFSLAAKLAATGDPASAEAAYREAIRIDPSFALAQAALASCCGNLRICRPRDRRKRRCRVWRL